MKNTFNRSRMKPGGVVVSAGFWQKSLVFFLSVFNLKLLQVQNSYLPNFPEDSNAAPSSARVSCTESSSGWFICTDTHTQHEYSHTHTHTVLSALNVILHLYSRVIFFYCSLHPHWDSRGVALLKLTPASSERRRRKSERGRGRREAEEEEGEEE